MNINGLYILLMIIGCICFYGVGYSAGKAEERKKSLKDLEARNNRDIKYETSRHIAL